MIRQHENPIALRAGLFSVLVHGILLGILLVSFNWSATKPMNVAEVELWDALPQQAQSKPLPKAVPVKPEPVKKVEPIKPVEKPQPAETPKADIQLKKEKSLPPKVEKPKEPPKEVKPTPEPKKSEPKPDPEQAKKELEKQNEALKKLQQEMLNEDTKATQATAAKAADAKVASINQGELDKYIAQITNKVRQNMNRQLCSTGKPEIVVSISLIPTGEVVGTPKMLQGSGNVACDEAVERAILQSSPLPVPKQADLFSPFRELKLKFRPNDGN